MRIVQIVPYLEIGGLERLAVDLAIEQRRQGHHPTIYCLSHSGPLAADAMAAGIPVRVFGKPLSGPGLARSGMLRRIGMPAISPRVLVALARQLSRDRADVVHTHNAVVHHYGTAAARFARIPVVVNTLHGIGSLAGDSRLNRIFRTTLPWTDCIVMVSENTRQYYIGERKLNAAKTRTILNGIPIERFVSMRAHPGSRWPRIRFGTAGRLVPAKDHSTLIRAFAIVSAELPGAELHLAGEGPLRGEIEDCINSLGLTGRVTLHGAVRDMPSFLSRLDVFVLSSATEGLPVVILEALAAGLPIVSTRVGGIREAIEEGQTAWFAEPGNPADLARGLMQAARSDLAGIGEHASRVARERFSIARMASQYDGLFRELVGSSKCPPAPDVIKSVA